MKRLFLLCAFILTVSISFSQVMPGVIYGTGGSNNPFTFTFNPADLSGTVLGQNDTFGPVSEIQFDPTGTFLYGTTGGGTSNLITIDPGTGVVSLIGSFSPPGRIQGLEFVGNTLYGTYFDISTISTSLVTIDIGTGNLTFLGIILTSGDPVQVINGMAYDQPSGIMYALASPYQDDGSWLITIDLTTAFPTPIGPIGSWGEYTFRGLTFGPDELLYSAGLFTGGIIYSIDKVTGMPTAVGPSIIGDGVSGLAYPAAPPPIPISDWAIYIGIFLMVAFILVRYRRRLLA